MREGERASSSPGSNSQSNCQPYQAVAQGALPEASGMGSIGFQFHGPASSRCSTRPRSKRCCRAPASRHGWPCGCTACFARARWSPVHMPLQALEPPVQFPGFEVTMVWHHRFHSDPASKWLRTVFVRLFEGLKVDTPRMRPPERRRADRLPGLRRALPIGPLRDRQFGRRPSRPSGPPRPGTCRSRGHPPSRQPHTAPASAVLLPTRPAHAA